MSHTGSIPRRALVAGPPALPALLNVEVELDRLCDRHGKQLVVDPITGPGTVADQLFGKAIWLLPGVGAIAKPAIQRVDLLHAELLRQ